MRNRAAHVVWVGDNSRLVPAPLATHLRRDGVNHYWSTAYHFA